MNSTEQPSTASRLNTESTEQQQSTASRVFECKTCGKGFSSFQALGGHRASHKKLRLVKGDGYSNMDGRLSSSSKSSSALHECSICGKGYAIGQALGGHMRRHRNNTSKESPSRSLSLSPPSSLPPEEEQLFSLPLLPHSSSPLAEEPRLSLPLLPQTPEPKTLKRKYYAVHNDKRLCLDLNLGPPCSYEEELDSEDHHHHQSTTKPYLGLTLFT
ncbi:hypothetical protein C5167_042623 [Papaver somniferum]|uniref:C2H2-type domain-containing protein n=1 Tax=Papaver somniferum TaxID=3469 RepID=A0A4Y7L528_PAPSO|nr:zinc finger protein ZAT1-like [Papaver somniferum]RZC80047.1 hypothetical protein C5167_042623 [Papaver somniferum]